MTAYALSSQKPPELLAVWPAGHAHRCAPVCQLSAAITGDAAADLSAALTQLSTVLWDRYTDHHAKSGEPGFADVLGAVHAPHLPDADGTVRVADDPSLQYGHILGRLLHTIGDADLTDTVVAEVHAEIDAIGRAGLGDLSGRAAQAVTVDHLDPSPAQIVAADHLLSAHPLGSAKLFTAVDPAAACVAAAHWVTAAAEIAADMAGINPATVFVWASSAHGCAVEGPTTVVRAVLQEHTAPRNVVIGMLTDAKAVGEGRVPDPAGLPERVDAVREHVQQLPPHSDPDEIIALLLETLTPLNPCRPSRDLLEQLLDGMYSCLLVYRHATDDRPPADGPGAPPDTSQTDTGQRDGTRRRNIDQFLTQVRARAARDHDRLTR